ncbi:hypothetical protein F1188_12005 [Roseospira marina]|uniref:Uncharacterized protein n=1 Tax=Roseospira marina TaxID=140057 RepID=A0A5M6IC17_9PROT|nr:hypothetical protein [Roseospira marina]KAA5605285.1 hypothetical protein F1188_12005 [Roseospira marina]MBB4314746.1 hypothetical protein [Roseospira marina]MBB5087735.1 hypothetical protein [Roseospira marina]
MPLGRPRRRRRSGRAFLILFLLLVIGGAIAAGLWYGYQTLSQTLRDRIVALEQQVTRLEAARDASERERGALSVDLEEARASLRYIETRYERDVPSGEAQALHELVVQMLNQGVDAERLAFLIRSAATPAVCDARPTTKQFMVAVPGLALNDGAVTFADGRITVSADGRFATDEQGRTEAWFDTAKPVRVRFARLGGGTDEVEGILPLHHSMVVGENELRFSVVPGRTGFAEVTGVRCDYP